MTDIIFLSLTNCGQKMQIVSFSVLSANYGIWKFEFWGNVVVAREIKLVPITSVASGGPAMTKINYPSSTNCGQKMQVFQFQYLVLTMGYESWILREYDCSWRDKIGANYFETLQLKFPNYFETFQLKSQCVLAGLSDIPASNFSTVGLVSETFQLQNSVL